jgi:hypothetical protein
MVASVAVAAPNSVVKYGALPFRAVISSSTAWINVLCAACIITQGQRLPEAMRSQVIMNDMATTKTVKHDTA